MPRTETAAPIGSDVHARQWREESAAMPSGAGEVLDFRGREGTAENVALPTGEPHLEDLVVGEAVLPDGGGDVALQGAGVQYRLAARRRPSRYSPNCPVTLPILPKRPLAGSTARDAPRTCAKLPRRQMPQRTLSHSAARKPVIPESAPPWYRSRRERQISPCHDSAG